MIKKYFTYWINKVKEQTASSKAQISSNIIELEYPFSPKSRFGYGKPAHQQLYDIINKNRNEYKQLLHSFLKYQKDFLNISPNSSCNKMAPHWINGYLPGLDAVSLYGFLSNVNPMTYIEIGSGNSTKFARRAIEDQNLKTKVISIDPHPRAEIDSLCDEIIRLPLEDVDLSASFDLQPNDIVFVDGTHRLFMGSDVAVAFLEIIPNLKKGVIVEFHDIFLPYDYPPDWSKYYYSEQYMIAAFLLANCRIFDILSPSAFICSDQELKKILDPIWRSIPGIEPHGGSFWIKI
jgi:hypothetical protein